MRQRSQHHGSAARRSSSIGRRPRPYRPFGRCGRSAERRPGGPFGATSATAPVASPAAPPTASSWQSSFTSLQRSWCDRVLRPFFVLEVFFLFRVSAFCPRMGRTRHIGGGRCGQHRSPSRPAPARPRGGDGQKAVHRGSVRSPRGSAPVITAATCCAAGAWPRRCSAVPPPAASRCSSRRALRPAARPNPAAAIAASPDQTEDPIMRNAAVLRSHA